MENTLNQELKEKMLEAINLNIKAGEVLEHEQEMEAAESVTSIAEQFAIEQNKETSRLLKDVFDFPTMDLEGWANGESGLVQITLHPTHFKRFLQLFHESRAKSNQ